MEAGHKKDRSDCRINFSLSDPPSAESAFLRTILRFEPISRRSFPLTFSADDLNLRPPLIVDNSRAALVLTPENLDAHSALIVKQLQAELSVAKIRTSYVINLDTS
jgi:hypothetical protein